MAFRAQHGPGIVLLMLQLEQGAEANSTEVAVGQFGLRRAACRRNARQVGGQAEMGQNLLDGIWVIDAGNEAQVAAAVVAAADVILKYAAEQLGV